MSLNIKSMEAHRLARELAQLRGVSLTHAVTEALREKLDREKHRRRDKPLSTELLEIGKRCAAHVRKPVKSSDHADLLYDKSGLPR
ncbi:MAG: type II toxin-antitoxin system VapB family antitoxin [Bryobacteraceae bacterium]|jgi:antitoxin VapB